MTTLGWHPIGDPTKRLADAINECLIQWGDDPAYADSALKLRQVERELDVITESPGAREARRSAGAKPSGQKPLGYQ